MESAVRRHYKRETVAYTTQLRGGSYPTFTVRPHPLLVSVLINVIGYTIVRPAIMLINVIQHSISSGAPYMLKLAENI